MSGLKRAKQNGVILRRPKRLNLDIKELRKMRDEEKLSFREIGKRIGASSGHVYKTLKKVGSKSP